jgi:hypothetical protein
MTSGVIGPAMRIGGFVGAVVSVLLMQPPIFGLLTKFSFRAPLSILIFRSYFHLLVSRHSLRFCYISLSQFCLAALEDFRVFSLR